MPHRRLAPTFFNHRPPGRWCVLLAAFIQSLFPGLIGAAPIPHSLVQSLASPATARQSGTQLGYAVALDGGLLAIGSPYDNRGGEDNGVVGIYNATTGDLLQLLTNPEPAEDSHFGWSVAVFGSRVVVGVPEDDTGASDAGVAYVYDLDSATPTVPVAALANPGGGNNDNFGWSVAISGDRVVIGVPEGDSGQGNAGCAYVYDLSSATPSVPLARLENPDPAGENFGFCVAASGSRVVVGSPQETLAGDSSRAHVYDFSLPAPEILVLSLSDATPASNERFGAAVAISGTTVVVSAPQEDTGAGNAGTAYVYHLGLPSPGLPVTTLNNPAPALDDAFGTSLAISGNRLAVGNHLHDQGAANSGRVHVFDLNSPTVPILIVDNPGPQSNDQFGFSVALSGTRLATGAHGDNTGATDAGSAYVFETTSANPAVPLSTINTPSPSSDEEFGKSVAISGDIAVAGADYNDIGSVANAGSVFLHDFRSASPGVPILTLDNPAPATNDYFGSAVAIAGNTVAVAAYQDDAGASNAGSVYVYNRGSATPSVPVITLPNPTPQSADEFGNAIALSGPLLVVGAAKNNLTGASDAGTAYVFDLSSATPTVPLAVLDNPAPAANDLFGTSVAISGTRVAVGAGGNDVNAVNNAGSVYIYDMASATRSVPVQILDNPTPVRGDCFGQAVAISGSTVIAGCPFADNGARDAGRVHAFDLTSATPTLPVATLLNPAPGTQDYFGSALAIAGTRVVVGASESDHAAEDGGSAFVYELSSATATDPADRLEPGDTGPGDLFGHAVAIDGTNIVSGAPLHDGLTSDRGAVHVFDPDPATAAIQVEHPAGTVLTEGAASVHFGNAAVGASGGSRSIVIRAVGTAPLALTGISLTDGNTSDFTVAGFALPATLQVDQSVSFDVAFVPVSTDSRLATLRIVSNAGSNSQFDITLTGHCLSPTNDTDGDGLNDVVELQLEGLGFDWQVNDEERLAILHSGAGAAGLFPASGIQAMHPGTTLLPLDPVTGKFKLTVALKKSVDLLHFAPLPMTAPQTAINGQGALEFSFTSPESNAFLRLEPR